MNPTLLAETVLNVVIGVGVLTLVWIACDWVSEKQRDACNGQDCVGCLSAVGVVFAGLFSVARGGKVRGIVYLIFACVAGTRAALLYHSPNVYEQVGVEAVAGWTCACAACLILSTSKLVEESEG